MERLGQLRLGKVFKFLIRYLIKVRSGVAKQILAGQGGSRQDFKFLIQSIDSWQGDALTEQGAARPGRDFKFLINLLIPGGAMRCLAWFDRARILSFLSKNETRLV